MPKQPLQSLGCTRVHTQTEQTIETTLTIGSKQYLRSLPRLKGRLAPIVHFNAYVIDWRAAYRPAVSVRAEDVSATACCIHPFD